MAAAAEREKSTIREYYEALLIAVIFVNFARIFVFQAFKIPTGSMEDNLKVGDHIIVNKFIYGPTGDSPLAKLFPLRDVQRGDIIVFRYPLAAGDRLREARRRSARRDDRIHDKSVSIERQAALRAVHLIHATESIYPGGDILPEPYRRRDNSGPLQVPPGQYFAMGDNRDDSSDSRLLGNRSSRP